jgi:hypothetical protein
MPLLISSKGIDQIGNDLPLVVVPIQLSDKFFVGKTARQETPEIGLIPIDTAKRLFERHDGRGR